MQTVTLEQERQKERLPLDEITCYKVCSTYYNYRPGLTLVSITQNRVTIFVLTSHT